MGIKEEITKIAVEQGYEGAKPKSIAQAIDALTDTLAGEDVSSPRSIAGAIHALAPYIGSGGSGAERVELFNETVTTVAVGDVGMATGALAYSGNIDGNTLTVTFDGVEYVLPKSDEYGYGASYGMDESVFDFSIYPLYIGFNPNTNEWALFTETAGTYTVIAYTDGSGGGGGSLGGYAVPIEFHNYKAGDSQENLRMIVYASAVPITWDAENEHYSTQNDKFVVEGSTGQGGSLSLSVCGDLYAVLQGTVTNDTTTEDFSVTYGDSVVEHETHFGTVDDTFGKGFFILLRIPRATDESWTPLMVTVGTAAPIG